MDFLQPAKLLSWGRKILTFLLNQGGVQVFGLVTGLLTVRWMSKDAYAQYNVAFAFQSSVGMLIDLGFTGTIVSLVGSRVNEPDIIGRYIRSALHFRNILFVVALPVGAGAFVWMTSHQPWSWPIKAALFCSVMFTLFFQGWTTYSSPLIMHQRFGPYYRTQFTTAAGRLGLTGIAYGLGVLTSTATAWINALAMAAAGTLFRYQARDLVRTPRYADPAANREVLRIAAPTIPPVIFTAFEGQIALYLITWFGKAHNIAEVAALGRLTQILLVLIAFNGLIIHPYIARLPRERLAGRYLLLACAGGSMGVGVWLLSLFFATPMLWLLGPKYMHLQVELPYTIAGWALYYLGSLLWAMNSGRKWIFWWHTTLYCVMLIVSQAVGVWLFDLSTTVGILKFSLMGAGATLLVQMLGAVYGFWYEKHPGARPAAAAGSVDPAVPVEWNEENTAPPVVPVDRQPSSADKP